MRERRPNLAQKSCRQCGVIPEVRLHRNICRDCALINSSIRNMDRYEAQRERLCEYHKLYYMLNRDVFIERYRERRRRLREQAAAS